MPRSRSLRSFTLSTNVGKGGPATPVQGPPSPTFSEATHASAMNFGADGPEKIITRANLRASIQAYENLVNTCASYRAALLTMAGATAAFADALESCSLLKGSRYEASTRFQAASGLHHLMGNHWHVLSETLDKKFEKPLRQHLDGYRAVVSERSASYERVLHEKSKLIRETEMTNLNKKSRNLQSFRQTLTILQRQVDELDELKAQHYQEVLDHEEEVWDVVQSKVSLVVRSTMDTFDRFTSKASDPVIEPMLQSVPDPFDSYGPPPAEDQIFSILAPLSLSMANPSPSPSPAPMTPVLEPKEGDVTPPNTWGTFHADFSAPWAEVTSPGTSPPSSVSPPRALSPTPAQLRRHSHPPPMPSATPALAHHQPRRSIESSKLRSVLSVITEGQSSGGKPQNGADEATRIDETSENNSVTIHNTTNGNNGWASHGLTEPSSQSHGGADVTPRSSYFPPESPTSPVTSGSRTPRLEDSAAAVPV